MSLNIPGKSLVCVIYMKGNPSTNLDTGSSGLGKAVSQSVCLSFQIHPLPATAMPTPGQLL